jgi:hypothetical protein
MVANWFLEYLTLKIRPISLTNSFKHTASLIPISKAFDPNIVLDEDYELEVELNQWLEGTNHAGIE